MTVITECPHGYGLPSACVECMADGPVADARHAERTYRAERWTVAEYPQRCRADARHPIEEGDRIGYVPDLGWCCARCATEADR